jgi:hypothetical protein
MASAVFILVFVFVFILKPTTADYCRLLPTTADCMYACTCLFLNLLEITVTQIGVLALLHHHLEIPIVALLAAREQLVHDVVIPLTLRLLQDACLFEEVGVTFRSPEQRVVVELEPGKLAETTGVVVTRRLGVT